MHRWLKEREVCIGESSRRDSLVNRSLRDKRIIPPLVRDDAPFVEYGHIVDGSTPAFPIAHNPDRLWSR
jgi:hypothetical protein